MVHAVTTVLMRPQQKGYHPNTGTEPSDMKCDCWKKLTPQKGSGLAAAGYRQPRPALMVLIVTHGWTLEEKPSPTVITIIHTTPTPQAFLVNFQTKIGSGITSCCNVYRGLRGISLLS